MLQMLLAYGEREMLTDEGRQKSDEGLRRGVNELFPQAVLLTMRENDLNDMLNSLYDLPVPKPFTPVNLSVNEQLYIATGQVLRDRRSKEPHSYFIAPDINGLPTIPESRNLTEYFVAVDVNNMLQLFASMLHERRIIITSSKLSTEQSLRVQHMITRSKVFDFVLAVVSVLHQLQMPKSAHLKRYFTAHTKLHYSNRDPQPPNPIRRCAFVLSWHNPHGEQQSLRYLCLLLALPQHSQTTAEQVSSLKSKLKKQSTATGSGVARAFMRAQAALFGSYRDALRYKPVRIQSLITTNHIVPYHCRVRLEPYFLHTCSTSSI
ncbi:DENN domain-containing protein 1B [Collichthys lucidus]|uniref:DENN domain-containing protein 1B n=1 Tax=Collichthys lucidus TaxID=240159 RepID=A0A4U5UI08_COLLU|nr:DENN domain-containing protein 1B [Collichthys lucidus]